MMPRNSGGRATRRATWIRVCNISILLSAEHEHDEGQQDVEQVGLNASALDPSEPAERTASRVYRGHEREVEDDIRRLAVECRPLGERAGQLLSPDVRSECPSKEPKEGISKRGGGVLNAGGTRRVPAVPDPDVTVDGPSRAQASSQSPCRDHGEQKKADHAH